MLEISAVHILLLLLLYAPTGQAMSPMGSVWKSFTDKLKIIYLTRVSMSCVSLILCLSICVNVTVQRL